jgi:hypothetical protein
MCLTSWSCPSSPATSRATPRATNCASCKAINPHSTCLHFEVQSNTACAVPVAMTPYTIPSPLPLAATPSLTVCSCVSVSTWPGALPALPRTAQDASQATLYMAYIPAETIFICKAMPLTKYSAAASTGSITKPGCTISQGDSSPLGCPVIVGMRLTTTRVQQYECKGAHLPSLLKFNAGP